MSKLTPLISASILSADFARLGEECTNVLQAGADTIHFDVMDNHYVPNLTVGPLVCKSLRNFGVTAPIDVHLMTEPVDNLIVDFAKAGATQISFHPEASKHVERSLKLIQESGCKAGLALNPATSLECLEYVLDQLSFILIMSVNPGFPGQKFIPSALEKIKATRSMLDHYKIKSTRIAVDGGVKISNLSKIRKAGADTFIMGSEIFEVTEKNYKTIVGKIRRTITS
ncbi:MAG: ribulose-phosphate 3-epimerase [Gammaproteobacteria bacterium]